MASNIPSKDGATTSPSRCEICLCNPETPKVLPCLHSFCLHCLQSHTQLTDPPTEPQRFSCPCCGMCIEAPGGSLEDFPTQSWLSEVEAKVEKTTAAAIEVKLCSICSVLKKSTPADYQCMTCSEFLCSICKQEHGRVKITASHQLRTLSRNHGSCSLHDEQALKYYCDTCAIYICMVCLMTSHKSCEVTDAKVVTDREKAWLQQLQQKYHQEAEDLQDKIRVHDAQSKSAEEKLKAINTARDHLRARRGSYLKIDLACQKLLCSCQPLSDLRSISDSLAKGIEVFESGVATTENLAGSQNIMSAPSGLIFDNSTTKQGSNIMKPNLKFTRVISVGSPLNGPSSVSPGTSDRKYFAVTDTSEAGSVFFFDYSGNVQNVFSEIYYEGCRYQLVTQCKVFYDDSFKMLYKVNDRHPIPPDSYNEEERAYIYASYSPRSSKMSKEIVSKIFFEPSAITLGDNLMFVLSSKSSFLAVDYEHDYDYDNDNDDDNDDDNDNNDDDNDDDNDNDFDDGYPNSHRGLGSYGDQNNQFKNPEFMCTECPNSESPTKTAQHLIYVSDHGNHCIKVLKCTIVKRKSDMIGAEFESTIGSHGSGPGQLNHPYGVCLYKESILVADYGNNRISMFGKDGLFQRHLLTIADGIEKPMGLAVDENNKLLFVTQFVTLTQLHEVRVYSLDNL